MIVYCKNHEINRDLWDNCIKNSRAVKPYGYSWYLDIMAPGWEALIDDEYDSVFPVPGFSRFGIRYVATPIFLQQLGAFSPDQPGIIAINEFIDYLPDFFKLIDLCVGHRPDVDGFEVIEKTNFELDLSKSYEKIREGFSSHCNRNIAVSERKGPVLISDISPDEIVELFLQNKGKTIHGIKASDYYRLKNLMHFCIKNNKGSIVGVRDRNNELIYGIFIVETDGCKTLLLVVNTPESRERRIGYFVVNEIIKKYSQTKTILNFVGSSIPSIASFMKSFGCVNVPYYRIYCNKLFWPLRLIK